MTEINEKKEIIIYKILILGDSSVGKTSILLQFCDGKYDPETLTTIGVDYKKKFIKRNNKNIQLNICDTAGQERFRAIAKNIIKSADGIIIMYDISNKISFHNIKDWINSIINNVDITKLCDILIKRRLYLCQDIKRVMNNFSKKSMILLETSMYF